jgi:hypothetical protein
MQLIKRWWPGASAPNQTAVLVQLVQDASRDPVLHLPRTEPHEAGRVLALAGFALGVWAAPQQLVHHSAVMWASLVTVTAGMLMHVLWKKRNAGWSVDFMRRRVEPVGLAGKAQDIAGPGWSIQVAPGDGRMALAIDLCHGPKGRVARLLEVSARGKSATFNLNQLADRLALRLDIPRAGLRL